MQKGSNPDLNWVKFQDPDPNTLKKITNFINNTDLDTIYSLATGIDPVPYSSKPDNFKKKYRSE